MEKNTAGKWIVFAYGLPDHASAGQPITGDAANITANMRIDGGAANAIDDTNPTELEDGYYIFDITATEANGDLLLLSPQSSTGNVQVIGVPGAVWTRPPNFNALGVESDGDLTKVNLAATVTTLTGHTAQTGDSYARLGAPAGASVSADVADIPTVAEFNARTLAAADYFDPAADTVANVTTVATTTTNTDMRGTDSAYTGTPPTAAAIADAVLDEALSGHATAGTLGKAVTDIEADTSELQSDDVPTLISNLENISAAQVNAEVDTALADIHLDHLLAVDYDPASKPGVATALFNELIESDAGVSRYTVNALENGPSGSGASAASIADAVWEEAIADHSGTTGSTAEQLAAAGAGGDPWDVTLPGAYASGKAGKILGDNLNATVSSRMAETSINTTAGAIDTVTTVTTTTTNTDMRGTDSAYTGTPPTAATIADAVLDEALSGHVTAGTMGKAVADIEVDTGTTLPATITTIDTVVDGIKAVTDNLPSSGALTDLPVDVTKISGSATAADNLELSTLTIVPGIATGTPTTTTMAASALTEDTDDHYKGRIIIWTSGVLQNQATDVTSYTGATNTFTFTATTEACSASDTFILI